MKFKITCTFSHTGNKNTIPYKSYKTDKINFEKGVHKGTFKDHIEVNKNEILFNKVSEYLNNNGLMHEYFTVSLKGIDLFTEEHWRG